MLAWPRVIQVPCADTQWRLSIVATSGAPSRVSTHRRHSRRDTHSQPLNGLVPLMSFAAQFGFLACRHVSARVSHQADDARSTSHAVPSPAICGLLSLRAVRAACHPRNGWRTCNENACKPASTTAAPPIAAVEQGPEGVPVARPANVRVSHRRQCQLLAHP